MSTLFSLLKIGSLKLKNRIVMPPMCMYRASDGFVNDFHVIHYGARALGGVGLIIVEATAVSPNGRISDSDLGLWDDKYVAGQAKIARAIADFGAVAAIQLAHAGRKSQASKSTPISPSDIAFSDELKKPKAMDISDIKELKSDFVSAAIRAEQAGYQAVEIHAAHGYLLNSFLSAKINTRTDEYGGELANRARLVLEILREIKSATGLAVGVRISATSWQSDDYSISESVQLAVWLEQAGADFIDVSSGGLYHAPDAPLYVAPLYQVEYARAIKQAVSVPVIAVGLIRSGGEGEAVLMGGMADMVAYGRALLANPNLAYEMAIELREPQMIEPSYARIASLKTR